MKKKNFFALISMMAIAILAVPMVVFAAPTTPITLAQVAQHNTAADCWTVVNGTVYNLTSFIPNHPGGQVIVAMCGIDGTAVLQSAPHGTSVLSSISNLQIGVLSNAPPTPPTPPTPPALDTTAPVITLIGNPVVEVNLGSTYVDNGAVAFDNVDGNITNNISVNNPVNTSVAGTYVVTYNVSDAAGNNAIQVTRTVIVGEQTQVPPTPPVVTPPVNEDQNKLNHHNAENEHEQEIEQENEHAVQVHIQSEHKENNHSGENTSHSKQNKNNDD